jgi:peptidoglycan/xylan/chitin deacetylase (PgdA/CDA1 family)
MNPLENARYPYWPLPDRPAIRWPNGARVAFWVVPNIEHFRFEGGERTAGTADPDVYTFGWRDYGLRVGIWRIMDILDRHGIRATAALNSEVCRFEPQVITAGNERGWEWMAHGITNSERLIGMDEPAERETIRTAIQTISEHTGATPTGWLGPGLGETARTPDLLAEAGITYVGDWCADDQPFPLRVRSGRLLALPYSIEFNDIPVFTRKGHTPQQFFEMIRDQFDVLYEEGQESGRVMALALHPYLSGHPYRARWLDRALEYITGHTGVWLATGGEIARSYYDHYYDQAPR